MRNIKIVHIFGPHIQVSESNGRNVFLFFLVDQLVENNFISINDGKNMSQELPWAGNNPNQGRSANYVQIQSHPVPMIVDADISRKSCVQCSVPRVIKVYLNKS